MKKVLLTAMTLVSIATSSVFGYYGANADWIDLLTDGNQFRARMDKLGFVLGNGTIKGTFGFKAENGAPLGAIFAPSTIKDGTDEKKYFANFIPTVSAGIGYSTEAFGIGVGYNYTYKHDTLRQIHNNNVTENGVGLSVHTPVITMNFLNNNLRLAVPVQVAVKNGNTEGQDKDNHMYYTGVSLDPQIRYYTGINAFNEIRLTVKYGMNEAGYIRNGEVEKDSVTTVSSFGFDFRAYFGAQAGDVALKPFLKVVYNTALEKHNLANSGIMAGSGKTQYSISTPFVEDYYDSNPWNLEILPVLGMSANSDAVSIYVEAGLGYQAVNTGFNKDNKNNHYKNIYGIQHALRWNAYGEVYIRPIQDLEWYFEAEIGNGMTQGIDYANAGMGGVYAGYGNGVQLNASTGITWYLPSFQE